MALFGLIGKSRNNSVKTKAEVNQLVDNIVGNNQQTTPQLNPEYNTFKAFQQNVENIITHNSEISKVLSQPTATIGDFFTAVNALEIFPVITNKWQRLQEWRNASAYPEVNWCLEEIADDFMHDDENGDFIHLVLNDKKKSLNDDRKEILQHEFEKYISLFNFRRDYFKLVKRFLIEGELAWENVIDPEHPTLGIKAVKFIPAEYYESLVDKNTGEKVGIFIDAQKLKLDISSIVSSTYYNSFKAFNALYGTTINSYSNNTCIPFLWPQLTYVSSAETTPDGLVPLSLLEKCKQARYQLALMSDSAVVMRVTRSPEKLLFNLDISNMTPKYAQDYIRQFGRDLESKKIIANPNELAKDNPDGTPNVTSVYHPSVMNTKWVFAKGAGMEGTTVETVASTANFEQMEDIEYFLRRLMKQCGVPFSRFKTPENVMEKNDSISYEEYAFSRQEIRFQNLFGEGFKNGFITHLKLRKLWNKYGLRESDILIRFTPPVLYDLYQNQKLVESKMTAYATIADREEFSKIYAMKTILKMTDEEIKQNYDNLIYEGMIMKKIEWAQDQLGERGPKDKSLPVPLIGDEEEDKDENENEGETELEKPNEEDAENTDQAETGEEEETAEEDNAGSEEESNVPEDFGLS